MAGATEAAKEVATNVAKSLLETYDSPGPLQQTAITVAVLYVVAVIALSVFSNILRDQGATPRKPYSLARTQLMWWTLIIGLCVILYCGEKGAVPAISGTVLVLLGIGAATTFSARIIDARQRDSAVANGNLPLHQDRPSEDFFTDILSDESGLSVPRFQSFVFNLLYGLSFLYSFCSTSIFPVYNPEALALLGISSASYVGVKALENKPAAPTTGQSDELIDAAVPPAQTASG
jgi:hypothetical protein